MAATAKRYRVQERSFINNRLFEEGDIVDYAGKPGKNLKPLKDAESEKPLGSLA